MARHVAGSDQAIGAAKHHQLSHQGHQIDTADLNILAVLQTDGRISNVDLSKRVGLSPPPTLRRVATLEERGFINGVHAVLNPKALGYQVTSFILVGLTSQANAEVATFEAAMQANSNVRECHALSGQRDFLCAAPFMTCRGRTTLSEPCFFKSLADRFARNPGAGPSDLVPTEKTREAAGRVLAQFRQRIESRFDVRVHGEVDYPARLRDATHPVELLYFQGNSYGRARLCATT
jgi:DNA-binding Lrp family transcriptional regulator